MSTEIKPLNIQIIPAEPGWDRMVPCRDDGGTVIGLWPDSVIAWAIRVYRGDRQHSDGTHDFYTSTTAITVNVVVGDGDWCDDLLRRPDGTICKPGSTDFEREQEAIDYLNERRREGKK